MNDRNEAVKALREVLDKAVYPGLSLYDGNRLRDEAWDGLALLAMEGPVMRVGANAALCLSLNALWRKATRDEYKEHGHDAYFGGIPVVVERTWWDGQSPEPLPEGSASSIKIKH